MARVLASANLHQGLRVAFFGSVSPGLPGQRRMQAEAVTGSRPGAVLPRRGESPAT
jgi:hypothetical protein